MADLTIIEAGSPVQYFRKIIECWKYRDLLWMLSYRDIKVRYAQTILGVAWAVINPVVSMLLLYFVFNVVVKVDTGGIPPLLFVMAGLIAWTYFSRTVGEAGNSIIGAQSLVKKVYFPRLIIPLSKAISGLVDLVIILIIVFIMLIIYRVPFTFQMLWVIPLIIMTLLAGIGFGVWVAALTIRFRDFSHILPLILRIGMFASPIAFAASLVPQSYRWAFNLNPLTGIIEGMRWALFNAEFDLSSAWISIGVIFFFLSTGTWYFLRMDQYIADVI